MYTPADVTLLRMGGVATARWWVSVAPLSKLKIWSGQVAGSTLRGSSTIPYDTGVGYNQAAVTDIQAGQLLTVVTSKGTVRIRVKSLTGDSAAGTLTVAENNLVWANNQVLTIYRDYPLWGVRPKIATDGTFYKDETVVYTTGNSWPPPVAVMGPDWAGWIDTDATAILDGTHSYAMTHGASISTYQWTVEPAAGATITNSTAATTTITFSVPGPYWVKLTVTDSNGTTGYTRSLFHAHGASYKPLVATGVRYTEDFATPSTAELTVTDSNYDPAVVPILGRVCCWAQDYWQGRRITGAGWTGREHIKWCGYVTRDTVKVLPHRVAIDLQANSALGLLNQIENYSISLTHVRTTPTTWWEYGNSGITVAQALHHLWHWHSTLFQTQPVLLPTGNLLRCAAVDDFERGTLLQQARNLAWTHGIYAQIAANSQGVIHVEQDAQLFPATASSGFDLDEPDFTGEMTVERQPVPSCNFVNVSGFSYTGTVSTPLISQAPGTVMGDLGDGAIDATRLILENQSSSNVLAGRLLAQENNETPTVSSELSAGLAVANAFRVVPQLWHELTLDPADAVRIDWSGGQEVVPRRVETTYDVGVVKQTVTFEPYATGEDGVTGVYPDPSVTEDTTGLCWQLDLANAYEDPDNPGQWKAPLIQVPCVPMPPPPGVIVIPDQPTDRPDLIPLPDDSDGWTPIPWSPDENWIVAWTPDEINFSPDGGDTWEDVTPTIDPPNTCGDAVPPTMADLEIVYVYAPSTPTNTLIATAIYRTPGGIVRSWVLTSHDLGQTWSFSAGITPDSTGLPTMAQSMLGSSWTLVHMTGSNTLFTGYWGALSDAYAIQDVNIITPGFYTVWGTVATRGYCPQCAQLGTDGIYDRGCKIGIGLVEATWGLGESGYKSTSGWLGAGTQSLVVKMEYAGIFQPCFECGEPYGTMINVGLCATADILPVTPSCAGTSMRDMYVNPEDGSLIYLLGWDESNQCIGTTTLNPFTGAVGTWTCIVSNVTQTEWEAGTKTGKLKGLWTPGVPGYGDEFYFYGTDGTDALVKKTTDGGATWTDAGTGLPTGYSVTSLITVGDGGGGVVNNYAFASDGKVYKQTGGTGNWSAGTAIGFIPTRVDVAHDASHTVVATDSLGRALTAAEPYTSWTVYPGTYPGGVIWG